MGTLINCSLLVLGTACFMCALFYLHLDRENNTFRNYIFFMGLFSATWILGYDLIGFTSNIIFIRIMRIVGMMSISGYLISLLWMLFTIVNMPSRIKYPSIIAFMLIAILTPIPFLAVFEQKELINFYGRITYKFTGHESKLYYLMFVAAFIISLVCALFWLFSTKEKQNKKIIRIIIAAHFFMLFSAIPDTILIRLDYPYLPTSCFGIAICYLVLFYNTARNNALSITISNISKYIYQAEDVNILVFDTTCKLSMANNSAKKFLQMTSKKNIGLEEIFNIDEKDSEILFAEIMKGETFTTKIFTKRKTLVSLVCNLINDRKGNPYCIIIYVNDLEKEAAIQKELEKASQAKSNFISHMSHEIRTPINAIIGMNQMILRENNDEQIKYYSNTIHHASESLLNIVNNLLDISKIESGKISLNSSKYNLAILIKECTKLVEENARRKSIELNVECSSRCPLHLIGDQIKIRQILTNLLTNAIKYTDKGSVSLKVGGEPKSHENGFYLQMTVADTGRGISKENMSRLFKPFERLDMEKNTTIEGTGLGLNITKKFVDFMGGAITVESEPDRGSIFTVTIPQSVYGTETIKDFETNSNEVTEQKYVCPFTSENSKILVVDDNEINLKVFTSLIKQTLIKTTISLSGYDALEKAAKEDFDIIFLDHMMPGMDGIETLKEMKKIEKLKDIPIIILTANAVQGMKEKFLANGFTDFISKPIDYKELEQMIMKHLPKEKVAINPNYAKQNEETNSSDENISSSRKDDSEKLRKYSASFCFELKSALEKCGNSESLLIECIEDLFSKKSFDEIEKFYSDRDMENYSIKIHSVKSSSRMLGIGSLYELTEKLQNLSDAKDWDSVATLHPQFAKEFSDYITMLND